MNGQLLSEGKIKDYEIASIIDELSENPNILSIALGGSRARKSFKSSSDYDLFCVIDDSGFDFLCAHFDIELERLQQIQFAATHPYKEGWGYLFKAFTCNSVLVDISIIPLSRISEMVVVDSNVVLYDPSGFYKRALSMVPKKPRSTERCIFNVAKLMLFERKKYSEAYMTGDYLKCLASAETIKRLLLELIWLQDRPEEPLRGRQENGFAVEFPEETAAIKSAYVVDGGLATLNTSARNLWQMAYRRLADSHFPESLQ